LTIYPAAILKRDLLAQAKAGRGKTGCFVISVL
jgi:superfamily II DNA/RNA helicase